MRPATPRPTRRRPCSTGWPCRPGRARCTGCRRAAGAWCGRCWVRLAPRCATTCASARSTGARIPRTRTGASRARACDTTCWRHCARSAPRRSGRSRRPRGSSARRPSCSMRLSIPRSRSSAAPRPCRSRRCASTLQRCGAWCSADLPATARCPSRSSRSTIEGRRPWTSVAACARWPSTARCASRAPMTARCPSPWRWRFPVALASATGRSRPSWPRAGDVVVSAEALGAARSSARGARETACARSGWAAPRRCRISSPTARSRARCAGRCPWWRPPAQIVWVAGVAVDERFAAAEGAPGTVGLSARVMP